MKKSIIIILLAYCICAADNAYDTIVTLNNTIKADAVFCQTIHAKKCYVDADTIAIIGSGSTIDEYKLIYINDTLHFIKTGSIRKVFTK